MSNIGINGFGRIGRLVLRASIDKGARVVAINEPVFDLDYMTYLFKYDSTHGPFKGTLESRDNCLIIKGHKITVFHEIEPENIPWATVNAEYIVEASGHFTQKPEAEQHLKGGAKKVIITALSTDALNLVYGVNHEDYKGSDNVISSSSCTINGLAPLAKVIDDHFEIVEGFVTTVHAVTSEQKAVDSHSNKFRSEGRCLMNIIPTETGAKALGKIIPKLDKKVTALAFRVPVANVSVVDFTVRLKKKTNPDEIRRKVREASTAGPLKGILGYTDQSVVSSDFITDEHSSVFDSNNLLSLEGNGHFFKLVCWYDNEYGYACRVIDIIKYMQTKNH